MKKIIINGRFLIHRVTGVERYAHEILSKLDDVVRPDIVEMVVPPEIEELPQYKNITVKKIGKLHNRKWEQVSLPLYAMKYKGILVNLCNVAPLLKPGIVCIHDVRIKATPESFSRKFIIWYRLLFFNSAKRAKKIITVSEFSKKEIIKYYKLAEDKIYVIPNAWQHYQQIGFDEGALEKYGLEVRNYFFSMCSLEPNKNFKWVAEAAKKNPDDIFAVAGSINREVFVNGVGFDCPDNMKLLGYVTDEEAKTLMRDSKAFLFPTFYEGFGIPPLEAVCAGAKCVIVSDIEIMHEVLGNGIIYIDPLKYEFDFKNLRDITDREAILDKYSWEKSARLLLDIIKETVK